ncbi:MAG: F0F1 ATP synthase subunit delta [Cellvibrionaceae bacterium]|nr:F0F1 ATP synthase subunit delta [Cellvibrionaceae bacterium]
MAELITLARPYAKAAFEYARSENSLDAWSQALSLLAAVAGQADVAELLASPKRTGSQKATALINVCGEQLNKKAQDFVHVLADNHRLPLLPAVAQLFESLKAQQQKFADVNIVSAFPLDDKTQQSLSAKLSKTLNSDVSLTTEIDTALLGGVVIRAGDTVIDSSVKGRLAKLAENFGISSPA